MQTATKAYLVLVEEVPLRPIRSDEELDRAIAAIDSLLDKPKLSRDQEDYLDVLSDLVHKYEQEVHPIEAASDSEMLRHLMESRGMTQTALSNATMIAVSTISEILGGKRRLARQHISAVSKFFGVSADAFEGR